MRGGSAEFRESLEANLNLAFGSEASVRWAAPGPFGVHDIAGNLWDWCEDDFHALDGFKVRKVDVPAGPHLVVPRMRGPEAREPESVNQ